jgi:ribosome-associated protein
LELAHLIVDALSDKKGENIILLDVAEITSFTDYFIICTGSSNRMLKALADGILEKTSDNYKKKNRIEGTPSAGWLVLDYGDIVVHLFDDELRKYYNLEDLWKDGKVILRMQ